VVVEANAPELAKSAEKATIVVIFIMSSPLFWFLVNRYLSVAPLLRWFALCVELIDMKRND
jgi:hypothetical protein